MSQNGMASIKFITEIVYKYLFTSIYNNIPQQWVTKFFLVRGDMFRLLMQPSSNHLNP